MEVIEGIVSRRGWFLINVAIIIGASASMYLIKPEFWLVGLMLAGLGLMYAWMWLLGKATRKVDGFVAKRRGLTPEQYEARKPIIRFDLGGWPFQKQAKEGPQELNGWFLLVSVTSAFMLAEYLQSL